MATPAWTCGGGIEHEDQLAPVLRAQRNGHQTGRPKIMDARSYFSLFCCDTKGEPLLRRNLTNARHIVIVGIGIAAAHNAVMGHWNMCWIRNILHKIVPAIGQVPLIPKQLHHLIGWVL